MKMDRKIYMLVFMVQLLLLVSAHAEDRVVATVNGSGIYDSDVRVVMSEKLPYVSFHKNISDEKMDALRREALNELVETELLYQAAEKTGMRPDEKAVERKLAKKKASFRSEKEFQESLGKSDLTEQKVRQQMNRADVVQQYLNEEVAKKAEVSDEYLAGYYTENSAKFLEPEKWKLREIFFRVAPGAAKAEKEQKRAAAENVLEKVRNGQDFGLLAWEFSEDDYKYKSGDIGYMHKEMLLPEIELALAGLRPGETTGVIETLFGFYIFYMESKSPARQLSFEEMKVKLRKEIQEKREKDLRKTLIEDLRSKAEISMIGERSQAPRP